MLNLPLGLAAGAAAGEAAAGAAAGAEVAAAAGLAAGAAGAAGLGASVGLAGAAAGAQAEASSVNRTIRDPNRFPSMAHSPEISVAPEYSTQPFRASKGRFGCARPGRGLHWAYHAGPRAVRPEREGG